MLVRWFYVGVLHYTILSTLTLNLFGNSKNATIIRQIRDKLLTGHQGGQGTSIIDALKAKMQHNDNTKKEKLGSNVIKKTIDKRFLKLSTLTAITTLSGSLFQ